MSIARTALLCLILAASAAAHAQFTFKTEIEAVELTPANIILPATASGMLSFRPCDSDCSEDYVRIQLTPATRFVIDGKRLEYDEFRRAFASAKRSPQAYALINYDVETRAATNIEVLQ